MHPCRLLLADTAPPPSRPPHPPRAHRPSLVRSRRHRALLPPTSLPRRPLRPPALLSPSRPARRSPSPARRSSQAPRHTRSLPFTDAPSPAARPTGHPSPPVASIRSRGKSRIFRPRWPPSPTPSPGPARGSCRSSSKSSALSKSADGLLSVARRGPRASGRLAGWCYLSRVTSDVSSPSVFSVELPFGHERNQRC